jgi:hypothetical protein
MPVSLDNVETSSAFVGFGASNARHVLAQAGMRSCGNLTTKIWALFSKVFGAFPGTFQFMDPNALGFHAFLSINRFCMFAGC